MWILKKKNPVKARTNAKSGPKQIHIKADLWVFSISNDKSSCFCSKVSVSAISQSQSRLIFHLTGSCSAGGLPLLVEFQEAGFFDHYGNRPFAAIGIFQRWQSPFLWSFGWFPVPANWNKHLLGLHNGLKNSYRLSRSIETVATLSYLKAQAWVPYLGLYL